MTVAQQPATGSSRAVGHGKRRIIPMPDFGVKVLGPNPQQTMRVVGLIRAGTSWRQLLEIGRYQRAWTEADVRRIIDANRVPMPDMPTARQAAPNAKVLPLAPRLLDVSDGMVKAWSNTEIADRTALPESTVKAYVRQIIAASGARDRIGYVVGVLTGSILPSLPDEHDAD